MAFLSIPFYKKENNGLFVVNDKDIFVIFFK